MDEATSEVSNEKENQKQDITQQLETEKKRNEELLMRIKYLQADFENLQKRCDRQIQHATTYSNERIIIQLLDVVDELEMAIKTAKTTNSAESIITGVEMTLKRLRKVLEQEGVNAIESQDKPFDPSKHNAVAAIERENVEGCVVTEEVRKGYTMKEKVIRPCTVKVAVNPSSKSQNKEEKINE